MHSYRQVLSVAGVTRLLVANLVMAAGIGAMPVAILLQLQARFGQLGAAGSAAGAFGLGNAAGLLIQGRLLDRFPHRRVIAGAAVCCVGIVACLALGSGFDVAWLSWPVFAAGFGLAGFVLPALTAAVRSDFAVRAGLQPVRLPSYSLLSVTFQAGMAVGPLLVSGVLLLTAPRWGLLIPAAAIATAAACFCSPNKRLAAATAGHLLPTDNEAPGPAGVSGRTQLDQRSSGSWLGLAALIVAATAAGAASGATSVGIPAVFATQPGLAGLPFAAIAVGDLVGGLLYGSRPAGPHLRRHLLLAQAATVIAAAVAVITSSWPPILTATLLAGAPASAPANIATSALLDDVTPASKVASAYTLLIGLSLVGSALASGLAGRLADHYGKTAPFAATPLLLGLGLISCIWWIRTERGTKRREP